MNITHADTLATTVEVPTPETAVLAPSDLLHAFGTLIDSFADRAARQGVVLDWSSFQMATHPLHAHDDDGDLVPGSETLAFCAEIEVL